MFLSGRTGRLCSSRFVNVNSRKLGSAGACSVSGALQAQAKQMSTEARKADFMTSTVRRLHMEMTESMRAKELASAKLPEEGFLSPYITFKLRATYLTPGRTSRRHLHGTSHDLAAAYLSTLHLSHRGRSVVYPRPRSRPQRTSIARCASTART